MNKVKIGLSLTAALVLLLFSCDNPLLTKPTIGDGEGTGGSRNAAPEGLKASHGEKRSITLSWDSNSNARSYYIYKADSPLEDFKLICETTNTEYKLIVHAGTTAYYRVSALLYEGGETPKSAYIKGTSLAQPLIYDITDVEDSSATVTWYMDNASNDTYKNNLLYTVYCFSDSAEPKQIDLDGSTLAENKATFERLSPNTKYEFQVEAYLDSDQYASEKSDKVDADTARRMRPGAPENLQASQGTFTNKIELTFVLPEMVELPDNNGEYIPKPLYFKIYKRPYSVSGTNEYTLYRSYFGSIPANAGAGGETFSGGYTSGTTVTWTDNVVNRGVDYEYMVQAYIDEEKFKNISTDDSKASAVGWALSEGSLNFGSVDYTLDTTTGKYSSAKLPLVFKFDPKGVTYNYSLVETIEPINDSHDNDPSDIVSKDNDLTYAAITSYVAQMNLTQKTTASTRGRGLYSYSVDIKLDGTTIDTIKTIGQTEVSEDTDQIIVDGFFVQDGYANKYVFKWHYYENRKYILYTSTTASGPWTELYSVNDTPNNDSEVSNPNYSYEYTNQTPGQTKYFAIRPYRVIDGKSKQGQMVYASSVSQTLGKPVLQQTVPSSYSLIKAVWEEVQKADAYRIKWNAGDGERIIEVPLGDPKLRINAEGKFEYDFIALGSNNTIDVTRAGKEIKVSLDALNKELQTEVGGAEISTSSEAINARLVGPAELSLSASKAASTTEINVSWDKISGASGYYVYRRQFNMDNSAEEGTKTIAYYVPSVESSITVTGKNLALDNSGIEEDTTTVKAAASFSGNRYTLKDSYLTDSEYNGVYNRHAGAYRYQQNDMAQGFSYRYYIVPVVNSGDYGAIDFNANNTGIVNYSITENGVKITYSGAVEQEGFAIGFGQNVKATKGTGTSVEGGDNNDRIKITWNPPPRLASSGISTNYTVYYRTYQSSWSRWETITTTTATTYLHNPTPGTIYEYAVGINGSEPADSSRFIARCENLLDARDFPDFLGFMFERVRIDSVSRREIKVGDQFAEEVKWFISKLRNPYDDEKNWGIEGYTIFLRIKDVNNGQWTTVDIPLSDLPSPNMDIQSYIYANDANNRLKVLRDYRHYYKVCTYVYNEEGKKIYSSGPAANEITDDMNTEYVKWGARQITDDEFAAIAALAIGAGMNDSISEGGNNTSKSASNTNALGAGDKYDLAIAFGGLKYHFVTITGSLSGRLTGNNRAPDQYGAKVRSYNILGSASGTDPSQSNLTFTGPSDVPELADYCTGRISITSMSSSSTAGSAYSVTYNGVTNNPDPKHWRNCFTFNAAYKATNSLNWTASTGWQ